MPQKARLFIDDSPIVVIWAGYPRIMVMIRLGGGSCNDPASRGRRVHPEPEVA